LYGEIQRKWVVSHSLKSLGPNATLVEDDIEALIRELGSAGWPAPAAAAPIKSII
jgi:hypothetical protein